jgi:hypothetical protein
MLYSAPMNAEDATRRRSERLEIIGEPRGEVMVYQPMVLTEVSRAGAVVETTFPLVIDSLHDFRIALGNRSIVVKGRVVHARVSNVEDQATVYRSGIEFVEPAERVIEAIGDFLDEVAAAKARS